MRHLFSAGDVVVIDFPGVTGVKRRPSVVLSSHEYHDARPDLIVGLITSQTAGATGPTDCELHDWASAGLRVKSVFRAFLVTVAPSGNAVKIGRLSDPDWIAVRQRLKLALTPLDQ